MPIYLDSNVFILAALSNEQKAEKAKELIKKVILGELDGITSALSVDEVVWIVWKKTKDRDIAIEEGSMLLQFDNLKIMEIDAKIIQESLKLMKTYKALKPRDSIHLAAAIGSGASVIVSDDSDFDNIKEIKRKSLE